MWCPCLGLLNVKLIQICVDQRVACEDEIGGGGHPIHSADVTVVVEAFVRSVESEQHDLAEASLKVFQYPRFLAFPQ